MKVASLLLVGICACAAKGGTLGQADSQSVGTALGSGIEASAEAFGPMNSTTTAADGCVTLSGDVADTDQDNIPTSATLTFNCTATSLGLTSTLTGTMNVTDDEPSAIAWAFTGSQTLDATVTDQRGDNITVTTSGELTATQQGGLGPFSARACGDRDDHGDGRARSIGVGRRDRGLGRHVHAAGHVVAGQRRGDRRFRCAAVRERGRRRQQRGGDDRDDGDARARSIVRDARDRRLGRGDVGERRPHRRAGCGLGGVRTVEHHVQRAIARSSNPLRVTAR